MALRKISRSGLALIGLLAAGCAVQTAPRWQLTADNELQLLSTALLEGQDRQAAWHLSEALRAATSTARPEAVGRVWLYACAIDMAKLDSSLCSHYAALPQSDQPESHRSYYAFLQGKWNAVAGDTLPAAYHSVVTAKDSASRESAVAVIADPQSRLIAAAACVQAGLCGQAVIDVAVDTASSQGWRGALYPWLLRQRDGLRQSGDAGGAAKVQARINLLRPVVAQ